jgi:Protein of unknown function (DUF3108)
MSVCPPVSVRVSTSAHLARALVLLASAAALLSPSRSEANDSWPASVQASYDVNFNGLNVGTYDFRSSNEGQSYKLDSNAKLSFLLGAISWTGITRASGKLAGETAKPQAFGFEYKAQSKSGATQMAFTDDTVTQVLHNPPPPPKDNIVPVQAQHLKGVLDPLSAVLALSRGTTGNPCGRRIPIYDGHQRFDLVLSIKGHIQIADRAAGVEPSIGYVCRVRYVPIAGHKADDQTKYMSQTNDIEIILRPMPGANIFIPHQVTIPTMAGSATLVARRVQVTTSTHQRLALVNE